VARGRALRRPLHAPLQAFPAIVHSARSSAWRRRGAGAHTACRRGKPHAQAAGKPPARKLPAAGRSRATRLFSRGKKSKIRSRLWAPIVVRETVQIPRCVERRPGRAAHASGAVRERRLCGLLLPARCRGLRARQGRFVLDRAPLQPGWLRSSARPAAGTARGPRTRTAARASARQESARLRTEPRRLRIAAPA